MKAYPEGVEPEFAALLESALMVLEDNARRDIRLEEAVVKAEKLAAALIATEEE